jgi:putative ABC transport system substrate-binding protein
MPKMSPNQTKGVRDEVEFSKNGPMRPPRGINIPLGPFFSILQELCSFYKDQTAIFKKEVTMKTKIAVLVFTFLVFLTAYVTEAQQPGKVPTIGYLSSFSGSAGTSSPQITGFLQGLKELGYVVGKNIAIEYRFAEGKLDRLSELAAELVRLKVDIIVAETGWPAFHAKKATQTIPIVMGTSGDPAGLIGWGLIESLDHPGGNVTGLTDGGGSFAGRRLQLLAKAVPKLTHVGVLWSGASSPGSDREWAETRAAAQPLNIQLYSLEARGPADLPAAFAEATRQQVQAVTVFDVSALAGAGAGPRTAELALQNRLPMISHWNSLTRQGVLMSYGADVFLPEQFRRAATYVDRILKGANPADLPVEQPKKFDLVINLKTAKALGLTIPQSVLNQADQVLE